MTSREELRILANSPPKNVDPQIWTTFVHITWIFALRFQEVKYVDPKDISYDKECDIWICEVSNPKVKKYVETQHVYIKNDLMDEELRKSNLTHLVSGLGLIKPQIDALAAYAIDDLRLTKIAIFHDDGSFGIENKNMLVEQLARYKIRPVEIASYNRFTMDIETPSRALIAADPKIVICLATSMPTRPKKQARAMPSNKYLRVIYI